MWIFKDNKDNVVTTIVLGVDERLASITNAICVFPEGTYAYARFLLEPRFLRNKLGFVFTISDTANPESWTNTIQAQHPGWKIKPYKLIEVEWE